MPLPYFKPNSHTVAPNGSFRRFKRTYSTARYVKEVRMDSRLAKSSRWSRLFLSLIAVLLALSGGAALHPAEAQTPLMSVDFSPQTPPIEHGIICAGQEYDIHVRPVIANGVVGPPVPLYGGVVV